jgi:hypothetical protein
MGGVIQRAREVFDDADLVQSASGIWCPSVQGPGGLILRDLSENSNDGTLTNMDTGDWVDRALDFNTNDYIDLGGKDFDGSLTIAGWFRTNTVASGTKCIVANCSGDGGRNDVTLEINRTAGRIGTAWGNVVIGTGSTSLAANRWYHAVVVRGGSSGNWDWRLYLDGALDAAGSTATDPNGSTEGTAIGRLGAYNGFYFDGLIDDVRIYPHALKPQQIKRLYSGGQGRGIGLRPSHYVYEPIRTLTYPTLSQGCTAAYIAEGDGSSKIRNHGSAGPQHNATPSANFPIVRNGGDLSFQGDGTAHSKIDVPDPAVNIGTGGDTAWAYSVWAWTTQANTAEYIWLNRRSSGRHQVSLSRATYDNYVVALLSADYAGSSISGPGTLNDGEWHHILFTQRDVSYRELYYDGELAGVDTTTRIPTGSNSDSQSFIGNGTSTAVHAWTGGIDDFREYNRYVSANEAKQLWGGGKRRSAYETSLVSPFVTQWGSVAEAAAFQAAWGANATTIAGVASGL